MARTIGLSIAVFFCDWSDGSLAICTVDKGKAVGDDFVLVQTGDVLEVLETLRLFAPVHLCNFICQVQLFVLL